MSPEKVKIQEAADTTSERTDARCVAGRSRPRQAKGHRRRRWRQLNASICRDPGTKAAGFVPDEARRFVKATKRVDQVAACEWVCMKAGIVQVVAQFEGFYFFDC